MSATSGPASQLPPEVIASIIEGYARSIRPAVGYILIVAIMPAMLIPLLAMMFVLSTPSSRKQPIFVLNVFSVVLGLVVAGLANHLTISAILNPTGGVSATEDLVYVVLYVWLPWITEAVLILRLIIVYSPQYSSRLHLALILVFTVVVKTARAVITILYLIEWSRRTQPSGTVNQFSTANVLNGWIEKAAWMLDLCDNLYISGLFLLRLVVQGNVFRGTCTWRVSSASGNRVSFGSRIKSLFWIASTNMIFALIFNLLQIIVIFTSNNVLLAGSIKMAGNYVSIISTVFATIWSGTASFKDAHQTIYGAGREEEVSGPLIFIDPKASSSSRMTATATIPSWEGAQISHEGHGGSSAVITDPGTSVTKL
ncbi:hypothetical protein BDW22DRAFT_1360614 [Trametopsis cervina]|nr:hypothetical protein BDW22DRAFT_1360614 [Trametopsis cervina]